MSTNANADDQVRRFYAYDTGNSAGIAIHAAPKKREWMDETDAAYAYRCLPLLMANQAGWIITCPASVAATWSGGERKEDIALQFEGPADTRIASHFGHGLLTFNIPFLFRTPEDVNLWVKGPSNSPKDGVQPLEGIVETDWSPATFTMNWQITRARHPVSFAKGEPICMIVPVPRGLAEGLTPVLARLDENPEVAQGFRNWEKSRAEFLRLLLEGNPEVVNRGWEKDYFKGVTAEGKSQPKHQTQITLKEFSTYGGQ